MNREEIERIGKKLIEEGYTSVSFSDSRRRISFKSKNKQSKSIDISHLTPEEREELKKALQEYAREVRKKQKEIEETSNENKSDENKKGQGEKKSKSENKLGESAEEFITTLLTQKYDKSRPILAQWISAHAEWNELLLNLGASAYRLYMLTRANGNVEEALKIAMSHRDVDEVVKDFENYFTALLKVKDDAKALLEWKEKAETLDQEAEILKQLAYIAIAQRDHAIMLLRLAIDLMNKSQLEKFVYLSLVLSSNEEQARQTQQNISQSLSKLLFTKS